MCQGWPQLASNIRRQFTTLVNSNTLGHGAPFSRFAGHLGKNHNYFTLTCESHCAPHHGIPSFGFGCHYQFIDTALTNKYGENVNAL